MIPCEDGQIRDGTGACITSEPTTFEYVSLFGSEGSGDGEFLRPRGVTTNSTHIFIADTGNHRIQIFDDMGNYAGQFGSISSDFGTIDDGTFNAPIGIATNSTHLFVSDSGNNRVQVFDFNGNFVAKFGSSGSGDGQFFSNRGITANNTHIFVADAGNHRVQIFDFNGNFVAKFGGTGPGFRGSGNGTDQFRNPQGITANSTHLFVADADNHRVQIFDHTGTFVSQFGGEGNGTGQFDNPVGITIHSTTLFVTDRDNHRVQVFDNAGNYVAQFGGEGNGTGEFNSPRGIITTSTHIFVAEHDNHRVQIFALPSSLIPCADDQIRDGTGTCVMPTDSPVLSFGSTGNGNGELGDPRAITTNNTHIFVTELDNDRVQIFDTDGNYVSKFSVTFGNPIC